MTIRNDNNSIEIEFRIPDELDSWVCRFEYTEVTVINDSLTQDMLTNLKKAGYELSCVETTDNKMVYGFKNPERYYGFLEVLEFYYSLRDYTEEILKDLRECIRIPFDIKLIVVNIEEIHQIIPN